MKNTHHAPALLLAALLAFATAPLAPAAPPAPKAVFPVAKHDFGNADNTETVDFDFPVRNEGSLPLDILSVRTSGGSTAATPTQTTVPPGGEAAIRVVFDLANRAGPQDKLVLVTLNDPECPTAVLRLTGTAVQTVRTRPASVFFGSVLPDSSRSRTFEVLSEIGTLEILAAETDSPWLLLEEAEATGIAPAAKTYRLTLAPDAPSGDISATVTLRLLASGVPKTLLLPVRAFLLPSP